MGIYKDDDDDVSDADGDGDGDGVTNGESMVHGWLIKFNQWSRVNNSYTGHSKVMIGYGRIMMIYVDL